MRRENSSAYASRIWRPPLWERIAGVGVSVAFLVFTVAILDSGTVRQNPEFIGLCLFFVVSSALFGLYSFATSLTMKKDALIVRNLGRQRRTSLGEVKALYSGYYGTEIRLNSGKWLFALAVQKPRISEFLHFKTRADEVETIVMDAVHRAQGFQL